MNAKAALYFAAVVLTGTGAVTFFVTDVPASVSVVACLLGIGCMLLADRMRG